MRKHPPSLNAIRYFECAARHLSFTQASEELFVTQSAVSKQIRSLEEQVGCQLFFRRGPKLELTEQGIRLLGKVSTAFEIINNSLKNLVRSSSNTITLSILPSFASLWLLPRLGKLESRFSDISVRFAPSYKLIDFDLEPEIDAAVRLTRNHHEGLYSVQLTRGRMFPVATPAIAGQISQIGDLSGQALLMENTPLDEWAQWFSALGHEMLGKDQKFYEDTGLQLQASIQGQGISLVREELVTPYLESGLLVRLFDLIITQTRTTILYALMIARKSKL